MYEFAYLPRCNASFWSNLQGSRFAFGQHAIIYCYLFCTSREQYDREQALDDFKLGEFSLL